MNFDTPNDFMTVKINAPMASSFKQTLAYCEILRKLNNESLLNYMSAVVVLSSLTPDIEPILKEVKPKEKVNWRQEGF